MCLALGTVSAKQSTDFGRMFPDLPLFQPADQLLVDLALAMQDPNAPVNDNPNGAPSGFTYLGQFLDHDLTLDATPLSEANIDIDAMVNNRTARLDLDSMYGGGQVASPELYDGAKFKFSSPNGFEDLQRTETGRAILAEGRNDENLIIAQFQIAFQKFHNAFIDQGLSFSEAQRAVRWHRQWVVVHDFLPHVAGQDAVNSVIAYNGAGKPRFNGHFYDAGDKRRPTMPIEFSAAAYRFGHSMVRLAYVMPTGSATKTQVFNAAGNDLHGSRPIPPNLKIDFNNFFDIPGNPIPPGRNIARKTDGLISKSLYSLPIGPVIPPGPSAVISLPERNLLRGKRLGLPSYQDVAQAMGITPYTNERLDPTGTLGLRNAAWGGKVPLWFGILKESELAENGARLGPTGRRIVAEVIIGIIDADKDSYFHSPEAWVPEGGSFGAADLLLFAGAVQ